MGDYREATPQPKQPQQTTQAVQGVQPEPPQPAAPQSCDRTTPLAPVLDVGEQVFGSSHVFELAAPWNQGPGEAQVTVEMADNAAFEVAAFPTVLSESGKMTSAALEQQLQSAIKIRFAPVAEGETPRRDFGADLNIQLRWPDGKVEHRTVRVRGRARTLEDRPAAARVNDAPASAPAAAAVPTPAAKGPYREGDRTRLDAAFETAKNKAGAIARSQHDAIGTVQQEAGSYVPPPMKHSVWWDLAEGAIMFGTGMIAGAIGKWLAEELVTGIAGTANKTVIDGLAGAMKDGMKAGAKAAVGALSHDDSYDVSSDKTIAFFEMQRDALRTLETDNTQVVIDRHTELTPLLGSDPGVAIAAMEAIAKVLHGEVKPADGHQRTSTAAAWIGFRSRVALGTETLATREHESVTDLAKARPAHPGPDLAYVKGLLEIDVDTTNEAPFVAAATVRGVAHSLAHELFGKQLSDYRIPMRLVVGHNEPEPTIITRDEAGRIRVSGNFNRLSRFSGDDLIRDEPQAELAARRLVDEILGHPLVPKTGEVTTDDQQRGE